MAINTEDIVRSVGRIKVLQDGRMRFIEFTTAKVMEVGDIGITVNPLGRRAIVTCRPDDLELVAPHSTDLRQTPISRTSGEQVAEANKPKPEPAPMPEPTHDTADPSETTLTAAAPSASAKGSIGVSGKVVEVTEDVSREVVAKAEERQPKPTLKEVKARKEAEEKVKPKPKPKPRRRRDR